MDFLVAKDDLHRCRFAHTQLAALGSGQALLSVQAFGLSANNITYAMFGEAMSYWSFFPAEAGWGRVPVWGFAEVVESRHSSLEPYTRVLGSRLLWRDSTTSAKPHTGTRPQPASAGKKLQ